jgi:hypothetical protein
MKPLKLSPLFFNIIQDDINNDIDKIKCSDAAGTLHYLGFVTVSAAQGFPLTMLFLECGYFFLSSKQQHSLKLY